jgi:hypothetical protein
MKILLGGRMSKSNVIDLKPLLKTKKSGKLHKVPGLLKAPSAPVIDMTEKREEILSKERRDKRRTILTEFVGAFLVLPNMGMNLGGLQKVFLYDISDNGLSFDIDTNIGQLRVGEEIAMRIYLSQKNYFSFVVKVSNSRFIRDEEIYRHGCEFVKSSVNKEALNYFVKFVEAVAVDLKVDGGDLLTHSSKK